MEFKVGDLVKVVGVDVESMDRPYVGKTGTICRISGYPFPYHVQFNNDEHAFNPECLQKVESEREFKVGDRVNWTCEGHTGTGVIVKNDGSKYRQWYVKRDDTSGPLNYNLWLNTCEIALIDSVITEHHGFHIGDMVAVRGSGFSGKIAEFSNANRPGGITVVVMNDRGEKRGITTTDIEKALIHKPAEKPRLQVGDKVKVVSGGNFVGMTGTLIRDDKSSVPFLVKFENDRERWFIERDLEKVEDAKPESTRLKVGDRVRVVKDKYDDRFVGKTGKIEKDDQTKAPFLVRFDDGDVSIGNNGTRWFYVDELVKIEDVKPVENKIKVGDTVKVVRNRSFRYGRIGVVVVKDESCVPFLVKFDDNTVYWYGTDSIEKVEEEKPQENKIKIGDKVKITSIDYTGTREFIGRTEVVKYVDYTRTFPIGIEIEKRGLRWFTEVCLKKVEGAKPVDDWRARFEAFKASHPVGTKVKIAKKVEDDRWAAIWVPRMDETIGKIGVITELRFNALGGYFIQLKVDGNLWCYPMDALEDVTEETNQYTFNAKRSDIDVNRIWEEANAEFAVVVDTDKLSKYVTVLHKAYTISGFSVSVAVRRENVESHIQQLKSAYENEKKQRVTVTIY